MTCPLCNDTGRAQTYRREGDTNQIAGFAKCICREPKPTKKGGQDMREISRGKWRHSREGDGVAYIMAGDVCIATIHGTQDGKDNETREREAFGNGEVMAASGALLSACRAMRQSLIEAHKYRRETDPDWPPVCLLEADVAIAQAEERHEWPPWPPVETGDTDAVDYDIEASDCCEGCGKPIPVRLGGICDACGDTHTSPELKA